MTRMLLALRGAPDEATTLELDGPRDGVRIGVGQPDGPRSSVWSVHAERGEVYVGNRDLMGFQKVSLHESGRWRFAFTKEKAASLLDVGQDRVLERWERPSELGSGWTLALHIYVASEDVSTLGRPRGKARSVAAIHWLPAPAPGKTAGLHLVIARPDLGEVEIDRRAYSLFGGFALQRSDGSPEACLILQSLTTPSAENRAWLNQTRAQFRNAAQDQGIDLSSSGMRACVFGHDSQGTRTFWDLGLGTPLGDI